MMALPGLFKRMDIKEQIPDSTPEFEEQWRHISWGDRDEVLHTLHNYKRDLNVSHLNILLHGPIGAGKSTFVNSVQSVFRGRMCCGALACSAQAEGASLGSTFTKKYKIHKLRDKDGALLRYHISDIMGVEPDDSRGVLNDDVLKILKGKIKEGYKFNTSGPICKKDAHYNSKPTLDDKVHCLVFVFSAESISRIKDSVYTKMNEVRTKAQDLDIPQVVIMTNVDIACPLVKNDLKKIYTSKKIKEKMEDCQLKLGVPMNYIFPVKNYSKEIALNTETDILILSALTNIVNFANDYVENQTEEKKFP